VGSNGITQLSNGNYLVRSSDWGSGGSYGSALGAVTWGNADAGVSGVVSSANSLVGSSIGDRVGSYGITQLSDGNYLVLSPDWGSGGSYGSGFGAVTWGNGATGVRGVVDSTNSLLGSTAGANYGFEGGEGLVSGITELAANRLLINSNLELNGAGKLDLVGISPFGFTGTPGYVASPNAQLFITPEQLAALASSGTHLILQANNDINLSTGSAITFPDGFGVANGDLTLRAGRSIELSSSITTNGSNLTLRANDPSVDLAYREAGAATITMAPGTAVDLSKPSASTGNLDVKLFADSGPLPINSNRFAGDGGLFSLFASPSQPPNYLDPGAGAAGVVSLQTLTAGLVSVDAQAGLQLNGSIEAIGASSSASPAYGRSIVLHVGAGDFVNTFGSGVFTASAGWLIYANSRSNDALTGANALLNTTPDSFKQYGKSFVDSAALAQASGNAVVYSFTPEITASLAGSVEKTYDGTTVASLSSANFAVEGLLDGDTVTIASATGSYLGAGTGVGDGPSARDVGTGKTVTSDVSIATDVQRVYGYQLTNSTATAAIGAITPAPLTISASIDSKLYDATTSSAFAPTLTSGSLGTGDTLLGLSQVFESKNVLGSGGSTLAVSGYTINDGNAGNNYSVTLQTASGTITKKDLSVSGLSATNKV
jgi:hypothetical protein